MTEKEYQPYINEQEILCDKVVEKYLDKGFEKVSSYNDCFILGKLKNNHLFLIRVCESNINTYLIDSNNILKIYQKRQGIQVITKDNDSEGIYVDYVNSRTELALLVLYITDNLENFLSYKPFLSSKI